jgi:hypothetical protein
MTEAFAIQLRDCTVADLRAASAPVVPFWDQRRRHPPFYLKAAENVLTLRCWGKGRSPGWSLRAVMHPSEHGVRLEGRIRCRGEVMLVGLFGGCGVVMGALAIGAALSGATAAMFATAVGAVLFLAVTALLIHRRRSALAERDVLAYEYLEEIIRPAT